MKMLNDKCKECDSLRAELVSMKLYAFNKVFSLVPVCNKTCENLKPFNSIFCHGAACMEMKILIYVFYIQQPILIEHVILITNIT